MGNIIRCLTGRDHDHGDDDYYPYYRTSSRWEDEPAAASRPPQQSLGPIHGGVSVTPAATASLAQDLQLNIESTSMVNMQPTTPVPAFSTLLVNFPSDIMNEMDVNMHRQGANLCKIEFFF